MSVALVTGSHGFVGTHLCALLRERGYAVHGVGRRPQAGTAEPGYDVLDLADATAVATLVADIRPDVVFHLATPSPVSTDVVEATSAVANGLGAGVSRSGHRTRVVNAGSSAQYGLVPRNANPVTERTVGNPVSAYGFAKAAAEAILLGHAVGGAFEVVPVRAFNHIGPGEPATTVAGALAGRVRAVLDGRATTVSVSDIDAVRDFTDVRDIARGYLDLAEKGTAGRVYNLCSGRATTVGELLDALLVAAGLDQSVVQVMTGAPKAHGGAVPYQVGSAELAIRDIGWRNMIEIGQSMADLLVTTEGRS